MWILTQLRKRQHVVQYLACWCLEIVRLQSVHEAAETLCTAAERHGRYENGVQKVTFHPAAVYDFHGEAGTCIKNVVSSRKMVLTHFPTIPFAQKSTVIFGSYLDKT